MSTNNIVLNNPKKNLNLGSILELLSVKEAKPVSDIYVIREVTDLFEFYSLDNDKFVENNRLTYRTLFHNMHDSDEHSSLTVYYYDGKPVFYIKKVGDRRSYDAVFIGENSRNIMFDYLVNFTLNENMGSNYYNNLDDEIDFSDYYTELVYDEDNKVSYSAIQNPTWSFCFNTNMDNMFYIKGQLEDTVILQKAEFKGYNDKKDRMIIVVDGKTKEVEFNEIIIKNK